MDNDERIAYLAGDANARLGADERAEIDKLRGVLAEPAMWVQPSPDLPERLLAAINDARNGEADSASSGAGPIPVPVTRAPAARRRSRPLRYAILGAAAAAVVAVAVAVTIAVIAGHHSGSPIRYAASLNGTALAPHASGDITLTRTTSGWKIQLHATGLPRRDNGAYYEAWLKNGSGSLVPIGTFNDGNNVTLWSAVSPASHPTITVTREVDDGDQSSSGQVVLTGRAHRDN